MCVNRGEFADWRRGNFWGKGHVHACPKTICFELDEPIEMPFGLGSADSGSNKGWGHIATIEKSMCDGDVAFFVKLRRLWSSLPAALFLYP